MTTARERALVRIKADAAIQAAFWAKVDRGAGDECWPWKGSIAPCKSSAGYGVFWVAQVSVWRDG